MAEYVIQDTSLTAIADQIRILFDITDEMNPSHMTQSIQAANAEVNNQFNYIEQIKAALYSKLVKSATICTVTASITSRGRTLSFQNIPKKPSLFFIIPNGNTTLNSTYQYITNIVYDGSSMFGVYSNKTTATAATTGFSHSYSGTTLSVTATTPYFYANLQYQLVYVIQPEQYAKDTIQTVSTTVTTRDRTISFSGLSSDPRAFVIVPTTNTTLNGSYQYSNNIVYNGSQLSQIYSNTTTATRQTSYISKSYNNGTLTVTLSNTPYFYANGTYKLIAVTTP